MYWPIVGDICLCVLVYCTSMLQFCHFFLLEYRNNFTLLFYLGRVECWLPYIFAHLKQLHWKTAVKGRVHAL